MTAETGLLHHVLALRPLYKRMSSMRYSSLAPYYRASSSPWPLSTRLVSSSGGSSSAEIRWMVCPSRRPIVCHASYATACSLSWVSMTSVLLLLLLLLLLSPLSPLPNRGKSRSIVLRAPASNCWSLCFARMLLASSRGPRCALVHSWVGAFWSGITSAWRATFRLSWSSGNGCLPSSFAASAGIATWILL